MRVLVLEVKTNKWFNAFIRLSNKSEMPTVNNGWIFNFKKNGVKQGKKTFVLVREETPKIIEGCMIFSMHKTFGPYIDMLEVAPHNKGKKVYIKEWQDV